MELEGPSYTIDGVDVAGSIWERTKGLMFREEGRLLLSFGYTSRWPIWMLFMRMEIDCIFLDEDYRVVSLKRDVPPLSLDPRTWRQYRPSRPCRYILEVESGLIEDIGIERGHQLRPMDRS